MNKYELVCQYCGHSWQVNYVPQDVVYCQKCMDSNIKTVDIRLEKVDYYDNRLSSFEEHHDRTPSEREDMEWRHTRDT